MFRIEASTSLSGSAFRPYQEADWRAAQIASDLAVFLKERLGMEVVMTYSTCYAGAGRAPAAFCNVQFPRVDHSICSFLDYNDLEHDPTPKEWAPGTSGSEFSERMLQEAARSLNLVLPSRFRRLEGWTGQVKNILKDAEHPVSA